MFDRTRYLRLPTGTITWPFFDGISNRLANGFKTASRSGGTGKASFASFLTAQISTYVVLGCEARWNVYALIRHASSGPRDGVGSRQRLYCGSGRRRRRE